jgi:predicted enzyme related to lactoylglutathione lyase
VAADLQLAADLGAGDQRDAVAATGLGTCSRIVCGHGTEHVRAVVCPEPPEDPPAVGFPVIYYEGAALAERDGYEHGVPCWVETWQEDPDAAATFYAGVFGWEVEKGIRPCTDTRYYMCRLRGSDVAAIGSPPPAGMPPAWTTYVWVDDADAVAASVVKAGGTLTEPCGSLDGRSSPTHPARCSACGRPAPIGARSASTSRAPTR